MIGRSRRIGPALLVVATFVIAALVVPSVRADARIDPARCPLPSGYVTSGVNDWQATGPDLYSLLCSVSDGSTFTISITVEFACPPAATDRFNQVKGSNLVERDGTLAYETETGKFEPNLGVWSNLEKTFIVISPTVFATFVTYSNAPIWGSPGAIGNATLEGLAATMVNDNAPVLPACNTPVATPTPPTPTPTPSQTPAPIPLCDEIRNLLSTFSAQDIKDAGVDPNKSGIRVGRAELTQGFVNAIADYNKANPLEGAYVTPGLPYGSAGALQWLFTSGGVPQLSKVSDKYVDGREKQLRQAIIDHSTFRPSLGLDPHLAPGDVYRLALDLTRGDAAQAMLLSHNTLRSLGRDGDLAFTGVQPDSTFYDKYLIKLRDGTENVGPWYHIFGIGYYQMVDDGDYGEFVTAGGWTLASVAGGWSFTGARILGALAKAGGAAHLALSNTEVTNALEQLYREEVGGNPPDPEKFCFNVWGAAIGGLLYDELPFKTFRNAGGPWSTFQRPPPLPPSDPSRSPMNTMINLTQSPFAVQWEQDGQVMVLDQGDSLEEVGLFGTVPGWVLPIPETTETWGVAWGQPGDTVQRVTLEATRDDASIEFVRMHGGTGDIAIYEFTAVNEGDRFTMTLDDSTVDPDIIGPDGEVIRPDRIVSIDIGDDIDPEAAPPDDDDNENLRTILGIAAATVAGLALVVLVVTLVSVRRNRRRPPTYGPPPPYYPPGPPPSW